MSRPDSVKGHTDKVKTGCGSLYITLSNPDEYQEMFFRLGKCGVCPLAFLDGIGRLISKGLNKVLTKELIIEAFLGIRCPTPTHDGPDEILSCPDAIAQYLKEELSRGKE